MNRRPRATVTGPVLDSADPLALAGFYSELLDWPIVEREEAEPGAPPGDGWAKIRSPAGTMKIEFQFEPAYVAPVWPTVAGEQQMMSHLDVGVDDLEAGVAWAVSLGASVAAHQPQQDVRVMLDPAGHPFCLFTDPWLAGDA